MIHELKETTVRRFNHYSRNWATTYHKAVIEGTSPGRIYTDHVTDPKTAFMCTVEGYYLQDTTATRVQHFCEQTYY